MGGEIRVRSTLGQGTTMTLVVPLRPPKGPSPTPDAAAGSLFQNTPPAFTRHLVTRKLGLTESRDRNKNCRLIVAEDTASSRRLIESMVERIGGRALRDRTVFATNGREALEAFQEAGSSVQLVILDMHMPEMDGLAACQAIRSAQLSLSRACPILALSADALTEQRQLALENGFTGYLTKPITLAQLTNVLLTHLSVEKADS